MKSIFGSLLAKPEPMQWRLDDLLTKPGQLKKKLQIKISGAPENNSPFNDEIFIGGDKYEFVHYGRNAIGTAEIPASPAPNELRVDGTWGAGGNAYLLPWKAGKLCLAELGQRHDFFFTATLSGCAVMVSGGICNPLVIHANTQSGQLDQVPIDQRVAKFREIYQGIAGKLGTTGTMDKDNLCVFQPGDYLMGAVFGVRKAGCWAFYANVWEGGGATTKKIWPK